MLEDARGQLDKLEAALPFRVVHLEAGPSARTALVERIRAEFVPHVIKYTEEIDAALRCASARPFLKEYSIRQLHHLLMLSPCMSRDGYKPLGSVAAGPAQEIYELLV